ncbi:hypothetical protein J1N35_038542 [Gossypium stocksii]|uniref:Uncharacterized protein n=1 Tax=Gossypium stocksii TaxID=47602 RepID=A0A9D3UM00_9ROSI|nr:hypothetical protein J1N35_038542 [Gossypium stocksii]
MKMVRLKCGFENGINIGAIGSKEGLSLGWKGYQVEHLSHTFLDHCPVLLDTTRKRRDDKRYRAKHFRFEARWCLEQSFEEEVKRNLADSFISIPVKLAKVRSSSNNGIT